MKKVLNYEDEFLQSVQPFTPTFNYLDPDPGPQSCWIRIQFFFGSLVRALCFWMLLGGKSWLMEGTFPGVRTTFARIMEPFFFSPTAPLGLAFYRLYTGAMSVNMFWNVADPDPSASELFGRIWRDIFCWVINFVYPYPNWIRIQQLCGSGSTQ